MAAFQRHWVKPGAAVFTKQGPRVALLSPPQNKEPPLRGGVHLRTRWQSSSPRKGSGGRRRGGWCRRPTSATMVTRSPGCTQ